MDMGLEKQWQGKKWYCYGTSMTDNNLTNYEDNDDNSGTGHYSHYLAKYSGLIQHNFGLGGSGIIPSLEHGGTIKSRTMTLEDGKQEADLITVEIIPNDGKGNLGVITDKGDDTFCGNLNQILEYLLTNTKALVIVLIATRSTLSAPCTEGALKRLEWEKATEEICKMHGVPCFNGAAEAGLGYYKMINKSPYIKDHIHLTKLGGKQLAQYFWGRLKNYYPYSDNVE